MGVGQIVSFACGVLGARMCCAFVLVSPYIFFCMCFCSCNYNCDTTSSFSCSREGWLMLVPLVIYDYFLAQTNNVKSVRFRRF